MIYLWFLSVTDKWIQNWTPTILPQIGVYEGYMNLFKTGMISLIVMSVALPVPAQTTDNAKHATGQTATGEKALDGATDTPLDSEEKKMKAQQLFDEGVLLFQQNRLADAGERFTAAYQMLPSWKLLYNIGQCEAGIKNWGGAIEAFEKYLQLGGDEITLVRQDEVLAELDRLKRMVGKVSVDGPLGYNVYIDGKFVGTSPIVSGVMIIIGMQHTVTVTDVETDAVVNTYAVTVSGGEHLHLTIKLPDEDAGTDASPVATGPVREPVEEATESITISSDSSLSSMKDSARKKISPALFFVSLSTAVVAGGVTLGLGLAINSKWESAQSDYNRDPWGYDTEQDNAIRHLQVVSYVTAGLAAVALASTIISIPFTEWRGKHRHRSSTIQMWPYGSSSAAGLVLLRSF
jgi:tetratricopeptide (TPR) repeat protein